MSVAFSVHPSVQLGYTFPSIDESDKDFASHLPRDVILSKNLKLEGQPKNKEPQYSRSPITKYYSTTSTTSNHENDDPLYELLVESRQTINAYKLELPFSRGSEQPAEVSKSRNTIPAAATRGVKRPRQASKENRYETNNPPTQPSSIYKTPIPNKTIFFSSSASSKKNSTKLLQSTPVSDLPDTISDNKAPTNLFSKMKTLKKDKAEILSLPLRTSVNPTALIKPDNDDENVEESSDYDHLACHAGNIMRMAVDSTMLGSSYSDSFSTTFNNTFGANDSALEPRRRYNDFLESDDADKSIIESMKSKWNTSLNRLKAKKIDINADELKEAVLAD